jgi:hypothetical protein
MLIAAAPPAAVRSNVEGQTIDRIYIDSLIATLEATLEKHPELAPASNE